SRPRRRSRLGRERLRPVAPFRPRQGARAARRQRAQPGAWPALPRAAGRAARLDFRHRLLPRLRGRNRAFFAGAGASWHATEHLRLAGALTFFKSHTYNRGRAGIAPLPVAVWDTRAVSFNLVFFPKVPQTNSIATFGFWLTLWPGGW